MSELWIHIEGCASCVLNAHQPTLRVGRAPENDLVVDHLSISRQHAMFYWRDEQAILQDLGSLNGIQVNGQPLTAPAVVEPTDEILLGTVPVRLEQRSYALAEVASEPVPEHLESRRFSVADLLPAPEGAAAGRAPDFLQAVHDLSRFLVQDGPLQPMFAELLDQLFTLLDPSRGAVLLLDRAGRLEQVTTRSSRGSDLHLRLSQTMVQAALSSGEAMLVQQPRADPRLSKAASIVLSGIHSILTVPLSHAGEVVGLLYLDAGPTRRSFTQDDLAWAATLGRLAATKVQQHRQASAFSDRREASRESLVALGIQQRLLPSRRPQLDLRFKLHGKLRPAADPGGDFFDYHWKGDRLYLCLGDVPGHGMAAVTTMAVVKTLFRAQALVLESPASLMAGVNERLLEDFEPGQLVRAFCGFLDLSTGRLVYSLAAHPAPWVLSPAGFARALPRRPALPLGLSADAEWPFQFTVLEPGELVVLISDALTDGLGPERIGELLAPCAKDDPMLVAKLLLDAAERAAGAAGPEDDLTALAVRYRGERSA